ASGYTKALQDISISIEKGEFVAIIGPSGCGKSTILSLIAQLIEQTEGEIKVDGHPLKEADFTIGYMLQQDYLFPWKTILENICIGPKIQQTIHSQTEIKAQSLLREVHLEHTKNHYPDSLSGG